MSDLRFGSGRSAALTAGLIGTMMVPLVVTAPAKAATITKTLEWNDGQPTQNADPSIVEGGVTYRLISQTDPVVASNVTNSSVTIRAQKLTATVTHGPNEQWPAAASNPASLFPETVQSDDGNGTTGTLRRGNISRGDVVPIIVGRSMTVSGTSPEDVRSQIPSSATNVNGPFLVVPDNLHPLWQATYTSNEAGGESVTYTATYPAVTIQKSSGTKRWTRTATYQSIDNLDANQQQQQQQQQQQLTEAQRQEEERRAKEQEEAAARQREQEAAAAAAQAQTVEDAKTQANQLIASVESQLNSADAGYVSDETKQQAQTAIDSLRQAIDGNDLVNINTAQGSLKLVYDRMTEEITAGKGSVEATTPEDGTDETTETTGDDTEDTNTDDDEDDKDDENRPHVSPSDPDGDDTNSNEGNKAIGIIPIAAGVLGLVAAGGVIAGVIVSRNKKKKQEQQLLDENGNPIDPTAMTQGVVIGPDGMPIDPTMAAAGMAGVAGVAGAAAGAAGAGMSGETVPQVTIMPAVEELESLSLIPGYVPIADSQCQLFAYLNDDENMPVQVWNATISPADDLPTLVEVPLPESEEDAFVAGWPEEDGSYRISTDENGEPVYQTDEEGNPILDEDGNPIPDFVIPQYFIVFAEEDIERAVSNGLLVYSDDGQEIYRGELGLYNEVDATVLWNVLNDQLPDEERTDIVEEITAYIGRLDEIEDNNDAMIADYEARRQQQIEEAEAAEKAAKEAQEAAMAAQSSQAAGNEFSVVGYQGYQDANLNAMGDYAVDSTSFEDVTDGIQDFGEPGAEYDAMNMTSDGFSMDGQLPYGNAQEDDGTFQDEGIQTFDMPGDDFGTVEEDEFEDFEDFEDVQDEPSGHDEFEAMPPAGTDGFDDGNGGYAMQSYDDQDSFGETTAGFAPNTGEDQQYVEQSDGYQQDSTYQGTASEDGFDEDGFDDFDDFEDPDTADGEYDGNGYDDGGYDQQQDWGPQEAEQPQQAYADGGYGDGNAAYESTGYDGAGYDDGDYDQGQQGWDDSGADEPMAMPAYDADGADANDMDPDEFFNGGAEGDGYDQQDDWGSQEAEQPQVDQAYDTGAGDMDPDEFFNGGAETDGYDQQDDWGHQETEQPQPAPAYPSETNELDPEDFFGNSVEDDFDDFDDMSDDEFGDIGGAVDAVKGTVEDMADSAGTAVGDAVDDAAQKVEETVVPRIKIPERRRSRRRS